MVSKEDFKNNLEKSIREVYEEQEGLVNEMMQPALYAFDYEAREAVFAFTVQAWEKNRAGLLHGGVLASMFDFVFGSLTRSLTELKFAPTLNLDLTFIKSVKAGEKIHIKGHVVSLGRSITNLYGEAVRFSDNKIIGSARASYFNANTADKGVGREMKKGKE